MKYFVFDVDGTLMNSAAVDQQCLKQTLHEFGRDYTFEELRPSFGKPGRQTLADLGFTGETAERIMDRWEGLSKERASEVLAFDGIEALLECLRRMGGTAAEAVYIGDSACDMECAAAAGVKSCLALWGIPEGACIRADIELAAPADALKLI